MEGMPSRSDFQKHESVDFKRNFIKKISKECLINESMDQRELNGQPHIVMMGHIGWTNMFSSLNLGCPS